MSAGKPWAALLGAPIAHRGLWAPGGPPENTLAAFDAAASAGYGMELDVRPSVDGEAVVFHDRRLDMRLTGAHGLVCDYRTAELAAIPIDGSAETIPTLPQVLARVDGRSLLVIELKVLGGEEGRLEKRVAELLADYDGPCAVLSFNPRTVAWFASHAPKLLRGLNSAAYDEAVAWAIPAEERRALLELEHVSAAEPHFLSLGRDMLPSPSADALRKQGLPVIAWTVRSPEQWARLRGHCDNLIFEGFQPEVSAA